MWILGILGILIWGTAEEIKLSVDAKKYRQSDDYKRYQELCNRIFKNKK